MKIPPFFAIVALALAFVIGKLAADAASGGTPNAGRNALTHDIVAKASWFVQHPLYRSLSLFELRSSVWLAALVATVASVGIVLWLLRNASRPLLFVLAGAALIPLSFLPLPESGSSSQSSQAARSASAGIAGK